MSSKRTKTEYLFTSVIFCFAECHSAVFRRYKPGFEIEFQQNLPVHAPECKLRVN